MHNVIKFCKTLKACNHFFILSIRIIYIMLMQKKTFKPFFVRSLKIVSRSMILAMPFSIDNNVKFLVSPVRLLMVNVV